MAKFLASLLLALCVYSAQPAQAVSLEAGSFDIVGLYWADTGLATPVSDASTVYAFKGVVTATEGGFDGLSGLDMDGFALSFATGTVNAGTSFSAQLLSDEITFTVTDISLAGFSTIQDQFVFSGSLLASSEAYDDQMLSFELTSSNLSPFGLFALQVQSASNGTIGAPSPAPAPLPAGAVLLVTGVTALTVMRRRS
ncbi:MAG: VPLPA-CTERM sorting domain-containing protein [Mangrovicoccus sp.]